MSIGAQFKPLPTVVGATSVIGNAGDVPQGEFAGVAVRTDLYLDLSFGVVEDEFVVLRAVDFFAAESGQCLLARQFPRRHLF